jgi:hypothetical protein
MCRNTESGTEVTSERANVVTLRDRDLEDRRRHRVGARRAAASLQLKAAHEDWPRWEDDRFPAPGAAV